MEWHIQPTSDPHAFNIQELSWDKVRLNIKDLAPNLFKIIESLDPGKNLTLIKARYPYGAKIIEDNKLYIPHKSGESVAIDEAALDQSLKNKLSYAAIPLSLPLNKGCEVFVKAIDTALPIKIISPGWFFGLFDACALLSDLPIRSIWSVSSGARSLFMLPKIANREGYLSIRKELGLSLEQPRHLSDHWSLFRTLSNHPSYINDWYTDVLFFTNAWFEQATSDPAWAIFCNYLFMEHNVQIHYNRDDLAFNLTCKNLVCSIGERHLKPRPYILDTAKHLVAIGAGMAPAFCPADASESLAPTKLLQNIYTEVYGLKKHLPTLMHAHTLMKGQKIRPVYYSLSYPTLQESFSKNYPDIIADQREIKRMFETLEVAIKNKKIHLPDDYNIFFGKKYDFFQSNKDFLNEMLAPETLLLEDPDFERDKISFPDRSFCTTSPFFSGCIRILTLEREAAPP